MTRIAIRADGGIGIGMGHVMRCLSLAKAFEKDGHEVWFFSRIPLGMDLIKKSGFRVLAPPNEKEASDPTEYQNEIDSIIKAVGEDRIDVLIIDSYRVDERYFLALKPHVHRLVYIDDENKIRIPADIVVNGNITAEYLQYNKYSDDQILLLGPQYNMIRDEFKEIHPRVVREKVTDVMITTGGTDPYNLTMELLAMFEGYEYFNDINFHVMVGSGFQNRRELVDIAKKNRHVRLYTTEPEQSNAYFTYTRMRNLMLQVDMAISAGGTTLYELAACGTPMLAFIMANNQEALVNIMAQLGYALTLGWYNKWEKTAVLQAVRTVMDDYGLRFRLAGQSQKLVDGLGTERIVRRVINSLGNEAQKQEE